MVVIYLLISIVFLDQVYFMQIHKIRARTSVAKMKGRVTVR